MTNIKTTKPRQTTSEPANTSDHHQPHQDTPAPSDHTSHLTINERAAQTKTRLETAKLIQTPKDSTGQPKPYSQTRREALSKAREVIQLFRAIEPTMELNQVLTYLEVALDDGVEMLEVRKKTKLLQPVLTRNVQALSPESYRKDKKGNPVAGHNLIIATDSPTDGRAKNLHLTVQGQALADKIAKKIENNL